MNDLEIMKSYCDKCKHKGTCTTICPTVWFAVLQRERTKRSECIECKFEPNDEPQTIRCPKCGRTDYIRDMEKDMGIKGSGYKYKCINCNTYIKDEPQTDCAWK